MAKYQIRSQLLGHEGAIRSLCVPQDGMLLTGAMDSVVKSWLLDTAASSAASYMETASLFDHEHWVTAMVALPSGGFATGSMDRKIRLFNLEMQCLATLEGHEGGVISLAITTDQRFLLSGSWDGTARVWDLATCECLRVLEGHENGVCVLGLPNGVIVTGSTGRQVENKVVDFQIRFFKEFELVKTLQDHNGPVRQLALLPNGAGFVSCSNDGSIKARALDGTQLVTMEHPLNAEGKPGFVLGVCVLRNGDIVSASEDCTVRVWNSMGQLKQMIEHPGGLWCVAALTRGEIDGFVTGCDDKIARVFMSNQDQQDESPEAVQVRAAFEQAVDEAKLVRQKGPSGVDIDKLPDYDRRIEVLGKSDGQIQMFKRNNKAWACQWSGPSRTWVDIGEVTGTGSGGVVDGQAYDMVIPVEIEQPGGGVQKLEIGYNQGQNPFTVAQEFIARHELDKNYLNQIADYIIQRSSEYRAPVIETSGDAGAGAGAATSNRSFKSFPPVAYNTFEATKIAKLVSTVEQFNEKLSSDVLSSTELDLLRSVVRTVQNTAFYHSSRVERTELEVLEKMLQNWPVENVFPALDLCRLVMVHPQGAEAINAELVINRVLQLAQIVETSRGEAVPTATPMLCLRVLCNMFLHGTCRAKLVSHKSEILSALKLFLLHPHKLVSISVATVLFNWSHLVTQNPSALSQQEVVQAVELTAELLDQQTRLTAPDEDTILRGLMALGTLLLRVDHKEEVKERVKPLLLALETRLSSWESIRLCVDEIKELTAMK